MKALNDSQTEYTYIVVDGKTFLVEVLEDEAVETVKKDAEKNEKSGIINIEDPSNIVAEKKGTPVESKEKAFEINVSKKEKLEEDLIRAFHSIEAIEGDELDIDFAPAEKHFSGNLRDKIGELLNKSNLIDENPVGKEAEKYWDELNALQKLGEEVIGLEKKNQVCVTYENNTFFINKKRETAGQDLEKVVADVISEKYLKAFIFGIQGDYEKYVATLKENPKWFGLNDGKKRELLESGIVFYVDEILNENEKSPSSDVREKIYKYAFTRLNK
ncbi:MAG: hypothetical protein ACD_67C00225G0005 [uncultured bacterium]|nr:MAG: hypothetical protein ACD_67C00225G0005 [uncultured bacterium]